MMLCPFVFVCMYVCIYLLESPIEIADYRISPLLENGISKLATFKE